jgi:hypothetical protein
MQLRSKTNLDGTADLPGPTEQTSARPFRGQSRMFYGAAATDMDGLPVKLPV